MAAYVKKKHHLMILIAIRIRIDKPKTRRVSIDVSDTANLLTQAKS